MTEEKKFFTPAEAAKYLTKKAGREINVNRLGQLRRAGKVKATKIGYNETIYTLEDLEEADTSLSTAGRKKDVSKEDTLQLDAVKPEAA